MQVVAEIEREQVDLMGLSFVVNMKVTRTAWLSARIGVRNQR
jgi:hypothetical protein